MAQFLESAVKLYEQKYTNPSKQEIYDWIFNQLDQDTSALFRLDQDKGIVTTATHRLRDAQSHIRTLNGGTALTYDVPISSEISMLNEEIKDSVALGMADTAAYAQNYAAWVNRLVVNHTNAHIMLKRKTAIDVLREGKFIPQTRNAQYDNLIIDFQRDVANDIAVDFSGTTTEEMLDIVLQQLANKFADINNVVAIGGRQIMQKIFTDPNVLEYMKANQANQIITQSMNSETPVDGLAFAGQFAPRGTVANGINFYTYTPSGGFKQNIDTAVVPFLASNEIVFFSRGTPAYKINRGVNVNAGMQSQRAVGDIVFDQWTQKDPTGDVFRSQARTMFAFGDIDHTIRVTGSNL